MKPKMEKEVILSLIKDDLVNHKLLLGLDALGLRAADYYLNISDTIFSLMGFPENKDSDRIYEHYLELTQKARFLNISESQNQLNQLAQEIYLELTVHRSTLKNDR
ncbi:hypothetical protein [Fluviicola taffensis]|uniref:hypothetical protein n=1 Tax=Fluviicola taffensis TaxID=191579 RepID=UPI0031377F77